jgi:peptide/nickel transport system substrate-binding protein
VSAANYINFFIDAKARADIDGFFTVNYGDYADPAALLATLVLPDGSQNYSGYSNPQVTQLMDQARTTPDDTQRAKFVADAQKLIMQDLPWIPDALPSSSLVTSSDLTGAVASFAYMFAPWANDLGGK